MKIGRIPYINCYPVYGAIDVGNAPDLHQAATALGSRSNTRRM